MKIKNCANKILLILLLIISGLITLNSALFPGVRQPWKLAKFYPISINILATIVLTYFVFKLGKNLHKSVKKRIILWVILGIQLLFQVYLSWTTYGAQGVDDMDMRLQVGSLLHNIFTWSPYYSWAPQNTVATLITVSFIKLASFIGISNVGVAVNLFLFSLTDLAILFGFQALKIVNQKLADYYILLAAFFLPLYVTALILYTDPIAQFFLMMSVYCFVKYTHQSGIISYTWLFATTISLILAALSKENLLIALIALVITLLFEERSSLIIRLTKSLAVLVIFFGIFSPTNSLIKKQVVTERDQIFPLTYWVYIGYSNATDGTVIKNGISTWDQVATGHVTVDQKKAFIRSQVKQDIKQLGPIGVVKLWLKKINVQWSLGTVGAEDHQFNYLQKYHLILDYIFGNKSQPVNTISQATYLIMWIGILISCCVCLKKKVKMEPLTLFMSLYVIGIFIFHILFWEVQPRYAYIVTLPTIMLATNGLRLVAEFDFSKLAIRRCGKVTLVGISLLLLAIGTGQLLGKNRTTSVSTVVLGQNFFRQEAYQLNPGVELKETINLKNRANTFNLALWNRHKVKAWLEKPDGKKVMVNQKENVANRFNPGKYTLVVKNTSSKVQRVPVFKSLDNLGVLQAQINNVKHTYLPFTFSMISSQRVKPITIYLVFILILAVILLLAFLI